MITSLDGPSSVEIVEVVASAPRPDEVLIRMRAAGASFPELLQTRGLYQNRPSLPFVPGAEVAGEILSAPDCSGFAIGDRVGAFTLTGDFAEQATASIGLTFHLADGLSFEQGATLGLNYLTAHFALIRPSVRSRS